MCIELGHLQEDQTYVEARIVIEFWVSKETGEGGMRLRGEALEHLSEYDTVVLASDYLAKFVCDCVPPFRSRSRLCLERPC